MSELSGSVQDANAAEEDSRATPAVPEQSKQNEGTPLNNTVADSANLLLISGLVVYGLTLFADYSARGRWAKNVTSLLAALGIFTLALALVLTPENTAILIRIAQTPVSRVLLGVSSLLLLMAIVAFGLITYSRPLRLRHERKIDRDLNRELPKLP
jgi:hypothetical protein